MKTLYVQKRWVHADLPCGSRTTAPGQPLLGLNFDRIVLLDRLPGDDRTNAWWGCTALTRLKPGGGVLELFDE